jgi:hypothetical protein
VEWGIRALPGRKNAFVHKMHTHDDDKTQLKILLGKDLGRSRRLKAKKSDMHAWIGRAAAADRQASPNS